MLHKVLSFSSEPGTTSGTVLFRRSEYSSQARPQDMVMDMWALLRDKKDNTSLADMTPVYIDFLFRGLAAYTDFHQDFFSRAFIRSLENSRLLNSLYGPDVFDLPVLTRSFLDSFRDNFPDDFLVVPLRQKGHVSCAIVWKVKEFPIQDSRYTGWLMVHPNLGGRNGADRLMVETTAWNTQYEWYIFTDVTGVLSEVRQKRMGTEELYKRLHTSCDVYGTLTYRNPDQPVGNCPIMEPVYTFEFLLYLRTVSWRDIPFHTRVYQVPNDTSKIVKTELWHEEELKPFQIRLRHPFTEEKALYGEMVSLADYFVLYLKHHDCDEETKAELEIQERIFITNHAVQQRMRETPIGGGQAILNQLHLKVEEMTLDTLACWKRLFPNEVKGCLSNEMNFFSALEQILNNARTNPAILWLVPTRILLKQNLAAVEESLPQVAKDYRVLIYKVYIEYERTCDQADTDLRIRLLESALEFAPRAVACLGKLAYLYRKAGNLEQFNRYNALAVELDPGLLLKQPDKKLAVRDIPGLMDKLIAKDPENPKWRLVKSNACLEIGQFETGFHCFSEGVRLLPSESAFEPGSGGSVFAESFTKRLGDHCFRCYKGMIHPSLPKETTVLALKRLYEEILPALPVAAQKEYYRLFLKEKTAGEFYAWADRLTGSFKSNGNIPLLRFICELRFEKSYGDRLLISVLKERFRNYHSSGHSFCEEMYRMLFLTGEKKTYEAAAIAHRLRMTWYPDDEELKAACAWLDEKCREELSQTLSAPDFADTFPADLDALIETVSPLEDPFSELPVAPPVKRSKIERITG